MATGDEEEFSRGGILTEAPDRNSGEVLSPSPVDGSLERAETSAPAHQDHTTTIRAGLAAGLVGQAAWLFLTIVNTVLIVRLLGQQVGVYYLFTTTSSLLGFLMDPLGLKWSSTYLIGQRPGRARHLLGATILACAACGLVVLVLGPRAAHLIAMFGSAPDATNILAPYIGLLALATSFNLLYLVTNAIILGNQKFAVYNLQQVVSAGLVTIGLLGICLSHTSVSPRRIILLWIASLSIAALTGLISVLGRIRGRPSEPLALAELAPGVRAYAINTLSFLHQRVDYYMVSWLLGASSLGVYGTAVTMAEAMGRISAIVGPVVYSKSSGERRHELAPRIPILLSLVASSTLALGLLFALAGRAFISIILGHDFSGAFVPTLVLVPGVVFMGMTSVLNNFMSGKGYPPILFAANMVALIVNVILNSFLITKLGIAGAALSSSVSYLCWFAALRIVYRRYLRNSQASPSTL